MLSITSTIERFTVGESEIELFKLIMTRNDVAYNCVMELKMFDDGHSALDCLNTMLKELINSCYPEMHDLIKNLTKRKNNLINEIKIINNEIKRLSNEK